MVEPHNYMRNIQKVETMKTQMSTVFMGVMGFLEFGKKCSKMVQKVVAAGARDPKGAVRAHLVAEKLSLSSYFCPRIFFLGETSDRAW